MRVAVKYCGSCNPEVDLGRIGNRVMEMARERGWEVVSLSEGHNADVLVVLCGCPRACAATEELCRQAKHCIMTAGKRVGWRAVGEEEMPAAIINDITSGQGH